MVSVVITAYNVAEYIEQAIKSVLNQELRDLEVVVVLDKPTDNTKEVVEKVAKETKDKRITIVENETNVGAGLSRRNGVEHTKGDYIMLLDGDDWIEPTFLKNLYDKAIEADADIVSGGVTIREMATPYYEIQSCGDCVTEGYDKIVKFWGLKTVFMNNRIYKRYLFDKVPYSHRRYIEDTPTIIPMLWFANKVVYVDEVGYNYRLNPKSLTHTSSWFKEFVFKGLCWCDLVEFFNAHDPEVYKHLDIRNYVKTIINQINTHIFTASEVNEYPSEYAEFMMRLSNLISINQINYKNGRNQ